MDPLRRHLHKQLCGTCGSRDGNANACEHSSLSFPREKKDKISFELKLLESLFPINAGLAQLLEAYLQIIATSRI